MTLVLDFALEFQQLHHLSVYLGCKVAGENALDSSLTKVVAEIPPLVH